MQKWYALEKGPWSFGEGAMDLCTHEKSVFFLPVNILTVWSPAFLATRHIVCLDTEAITLIS